MKHQPATDELFDELWQQLEDDVSSAVESLDRPSRPAAIVGIPYREAGRDLAAVGRTACRGLEAMGIERDSLLLAVGPAGGRDPNELAGFDLDPRLHGRHWSSLALIEVASRLQAPLVLLSPDLRPQRDDLGPPGLGYAPPWIERLIRAVTDDDLDLALARFSRHPLANPVESLVAFPVVTGIFGYRLRQPMPGVLGLSVGMARAMSEARRSWPYRHGPYGFDLWTTAFAVAGGWEIGEVPLGLASFRHDLSKIKPIFHQATSALLAVATEYRDKWLDRPAPVEQPYVCGPIWEQIPVPVALPTDDLVRRLKAEFDHFDETLYQDIVPAEIRAEMQEWVDRRGEGAGLTAERWVEILQVFATAHGFPGQFHPADAVDGLFPFFLARLIGFVGEVGDLRRALEDSSPAGAIHVGAAHQLSEKRLEHQADLMANGWPELRRSWRQRKTAAGPYLARIGAWEFVPHVGIVVPQEIGGPGGKTVFAHQVYQDLLDRYRREFVDFLAEHLGLDRLADSTEILARVQGFMRRLETGLARDLFPYDLASNAGAEALLERLVRDLSAGRSFQLTPDAVRRILTKAPPLNLLVKQGVPTVGELLKRFEPNEALGLTAWTDRQQYLDQVVDILAREAEPGWFHAAAIDPLVVDVRDVEHLDEVRGTAALTRLAGRLVLGVQPRGQGGDLPVLWYTLRALKRLASIELFSDVWQGFADRSDDFGQRLVASIRGHWGRHVLSAHNAFESRQQRLVAERLARLAQLHAEPGTRTAETAALLAGAASVYHLSITLPDATFVPLSAWTWASYSNRGGRGAPSPLSSLVERDWATRDFVAAYLERAGRGDEATVDREIAELMGEEQESADLGQILFGVEVDADSLLPPPPHRAEWRAAGVLSRPVEGPILSPNPDHAWESRYVLNAGAVRLDGKIHIVYRAFGDDKISRLGLAWTGDGIRIDGRLDEPIFAPGDPSESAGCEDPRITVIGDRLYMLYTAYDGTLPQIAMASIEVSDFLAQRFDAWHRHGLGFPGLANKDAALYPEPIGGRYVLYHRIDPAMWISYLDELDCPWPRTGHKIVVGPRSGMMWDGIKIGAGAQPIKTAQGWLNIYHGVDFERTYRLGVLVTDLYDPSKVIYQSPNPILQPEFDFEIGHVNGGDFWVPRVVFTCGAVVARETDVATPDDEILVYYGAADTAIGVATARIGDLMPLD